MYVDRDNTKNTQGDADIYTVSMSLNLKLIVEYVECCESHSLHKERTQFCNTRKLTSVFLSNELR